MLIRQGCQALILFYDSPIKIFFMCKPVTGILPSLLLLILIGTYASMAYTFQAAPVETPAVRVSPTPVPSLTPATETLQDTGWFWLWAGMERRLITIYNDREQLRESVHIWRLDQKYFRLDVAFDETPKSLDDWQKETGAAMVLNGGYFSIVNDKYFPDGLMIIKGKASGRSFSGYGGMLVIRGNQAELRWLVQRPYNPRERLQAALQSFPMLVKPGGRLGFPAEREDHARARRTVIAQDKEGRILLIVAPQGYFTLHRLSAFLTESDLDLDIAFNLDGGGSTGILLANPRQIIDSKVLLPYVILVHPQ